MSLSNNSLPLSSSSVTSSLLGFGLGLGGGNGSSSSSLDPQSLLSMPTPGLSIAQSPVQSAAAVATEQSDADRGIEVDVLHPDAFPVAAWLCDYSMHMYRWAGNAVEWTEYALRMRPEMLNLLETPGDTHYEYFAKKSGCNLSIHSEKLNGSVEKFLVFVRGPTGSPENAFMATALEWVCLAFKRALMAGEILIADGSNDMIDVDDEEIAALPNIYPTPHRIEANWVALGHGRYQRVLDIPQVAVGLVAGKGGKKLFAMRKKSGAYMSLVSKLKSNVPAKLTISGTADAVGAAIGLVRAALADKVMII